MQHTSVQLALSGALQPRRVVVSDEKCNVCHAVLGTTSGSNTMPSAFHSGARTTWQACIVCHDANRVSSTVMTDGQQLNEAYKFDRMIHGIHGNAMRFFPFTNGNTVVGAFCNPGNTSPEAKAACDPALTLAPDVNNFAAKVLWPGVGLNCNALNRDFALFKTLGINLNIAASWFTSQLLFINPFQAKLTQLVVSLISAFAVAQLFFVDPAKISKEMRA